MSRRVATLGAALIMLVLLLGVARIVKVPYVILLPGPVTNTLGNVPATDTVNNKPGGPVITITGAVTHPTTGQLYLTTVEELPGDCGSDPTLWDAVKAWFSRSQTVEPKAVECPPGQSSHAVQQQDAQEMSQSQSDAVTAALFQLGYHPTTQHVTVNTVEPGVPAARVLEPGDILLAVNGTAVNTVAQLHTAVAKVPVGSAISLTIQRNGKTRTVATKTIKGVGGASMVGFTPDRTATFGNVKVRIGIDPDVIGGPSAGTALALGIIDKMTADSLTGGRTIAGTGTVDGFGLVGPIGGIQQKIAAAVKAGATVFFAPASECPDAKAAAPRSLTLIKVSTLGGAVKALQTINSGGTSFPRC
jgi:Lon-like protease